MQLNNMKVMRDALVQVELFLSRVERHGHPTLNPGDRCDACEGTEELRELVCTALSKQPRNCDVGTVDEQDERFEAFCKRYLREDAPCSEDCPCRFWGMLGGECSIKWAQMPYEEGDAK